MMVSIALLLTLLFVSPYQETATIDGTLTASDGSGPIARARIYLSRRSAGGNGEYATASRSDGRFTFKDVVPGKYVLLAKQVGFIDSEYGQKRVSLPGTPIEVTAGQSIHDLKIQMTRGSVVSGKVFDQTGRPIAKATVRLRKSAYTPEGRPEILSVAFTQTNDLGEYRLFWVTPGTYYAIATISNQAQQLDPMQHNYGLIINEQFATAEDVYLPTFYPNSFDMATATPLQVSAGTEMRGIDFTMRPVPTVRLSGKVLNAESATIPDLEVSVHEKHSLSDVNGFSRTTRVKANGEFEVRDVPGGFLYTISAGSSGRNPRPSPLRTEMELQIGDKDVTNLNLVLRSEQINPIRGHVSFEPTVREQRISLEFMSLDGYQRTGGVGVDNQGNFTSRPAPGVHGIQLTAAEGYFIQSARSGSRDVLRDGIDSTAGPPDPLEIMLSFSTAAIEGTVTDAEGKTSAGAQIVLVPIFVAPAQPRSFRDTVTDSFGHFTIRGVTPGTYKLFAFDQLEPYSYYDPGFLSTYGAQGVPIDIGQSGTINATPKLIK